MAGGEAEHRPHHRLDPAEPVLGRRRGPATSRPRDLVGAAVDHRLEQHLLRREPVEDRLLADARARPARSSSDVARSRGCRRRPSRRSRIRSSVGVAVIPALRHARLPNGRQGGDDPERLDGKRIADHRRHRLPRHRPRRAAAALRARLRARAAGPTRARGRRSSSGPSGRSSATTPSTACASELGKDGFAAMVGRAGHADRRRRRHRRPRPRRRRPGRAGGVRRRHPLRRHGVVRLAARRRRRGQPARPDPDRRRRSHDLGVTPHLVSVSTCYVAGNRRGAAPEQPGAREPVLRRRRLARPRSTAPAGPAPTPRPTAADPTRSPASARRPAHELGAAGIPALAGQDRAAPQRVGEGPDGRGRPGPGRLARLARRLRLHEGARRAGAAAEPRRRARVDRAPVDHRVGAARAAARAGSAASAWPSR